MPPTAIGNPHPQEAAVVRRYFVSKMVTVDFGDGPERRPKVLAGRLPEGTSAAVAVHPSGNWALVVLSNPAGVPAFPGDSEVDALPDVSLDVEHGAIDRGRRNAAEAALRKHGANVPDVLNGDGYRAFIRGVGRQCRPDFSEDDFGLPG